jgi:hypothetical protein
MNAIINATALNTDELKKNSDIRIMNHGDRIDNLNELFNVGRTHADYFVSQEEFEKEARTNGTGYFDPLITAIFHDENGQPVPVNSGISMWDPKTNRRLFVVVIDQGNNLIVHDRYAPGNRDCLVVTSKVNGQALLGMEPCWTPKVMFDFVNCCRMFGFEYDRHANTIYFPRWKKDNWFKTCRNQLIPTPQEQFETEA